MTKQQPKRGKYWLEMQVLVIGGPDFRKKCKYRRNLRCGVPEHLCSSCAEAR
jgi:hypothetical protein